MPATASILVMKFTGASTYTSLSGVRHEMRVALPLQLAFAILGLVLWLIGRFL
jgi:acetyl-CoA decarbonylase/synthase complex subunit gamma